MIIIQKCQFRAEFFTGNYIRFFSPHMNQMIIIVSVYVPAAFTSDLGWQKGEELVVMHNTPSITQLALGICSSSDTVAVAQCPENE